MRNVYERIRHGFERGLAGLIRYLETDLHEEVGLLNEKRVPALKSGWKTLDGVLGPNGLAAGCCVEIQCLTPSPLRDLEVIAHWTAAFQADGAVIGFLDPFGEFGPTLLNKTGLDPQSTLIFPMQSRLDLTRTAVSALERHVLDLLVVPPGVWDQAWLADGKDKNGADRPLERLERCLAAIAWLGRRNRTTLLIVCRPESNRPQRPLGFTQIRLALEPGRPAGRRLRFRVLHNVFAPRSVGKTARCRIERKEDQKR